MTARKRYEFAPRRCAHPGCHTRFTPTGCNAKYCGEHQDAALRKRGRWSVLRERARNRPIQGDRCECCGAPAKGASYHGVVCCEQCRKDADYAAREWLEERRARDERDRRTA